MIAVSLTAASNDMFFDKRAASDAVTCGHSTVVCHPRYI